MDTRAVGAKKLRDYFNSDNFTGYTKYDSSGIRHNYKLKIYIEEKPKETEWFKDYVVVRWKVATADDYWSNRPDAMCEEVANWLRRLADNLTDFPHLVTYSFDI